jgi:hypothetical protein
MAAVEHEYTFDETMPIDLSSRRTFLVIPRIHHEATLCPPLGAMLVVGYVPSPETRMTPALPQLYRIDPSAV